LYFLLHILWLGYTRSTEGTFAFKTHFSSLSQPLRWDWVGLTYMMGVIFCVAAAWLFKLDFPWVKSAHPNDLLMGAIIIGLFCAGFVAPYCAPDDEVSMREAALGLSLLGLTVGCIYGKTAIDILTISLLMAILGALGGWLGEALRDPGTGDETRQN
jgi:hypothetical protein